MSTKHIQCAVGRKVYSLQCGENSVPKIQALSAVLNQMVNSNTVKYSNLSDDNLFFITALELIDKLQNPTNTPSTPVASNAPDKTTLQNDKSSLILKETELFMEELLASLKKINEIAENA